MICNFNLNNQMIIVINLNLNLMQTDIHLFIINNINNKILTNIDIGAIFKKKGKF